MNQVWYSIFNNRILYSKENELQNKMHEFLKHNAEQGILWGGIYNMNPFT